VVDQHLEVVLESLFIKLNLVDDSHVDQFSLGDEPTRERSGEGVSAK
jgi:hypothetical protein